MLASAFTGCVHCLSASAALTSLQCVEQVELTGLIPPWVVDRVCAACITAQGGAYRAVLDTLPASGCLNVPPPAGAVVGPARADMDSAAGCVFELLSAVRILSFVCGHDNVQRVATALRHKMLFCSVVYHRR